MKRREAPCERALFAHDASVITYGRTKTSTQPTDVDLDVGNAQADAQWHDVLEMPAASQAAAAPPPGGGSSQDEPAAALVVRRQALVWRTITR